MQDAMRQETLLFVIDREQNRVLLAMKKVRFGAGKYNGMGGKVEDGETPAQAAVREAQEEVGVRVAVPTAKDMGKVSFSFEGKPDWSRLVHVFVAEEWEGEPKESEEMVPEWFAFEDIPYERMWVDDRYWLPKVLAGERIEASFHLAGDGSAILEQSITLL